MCIRDSPNPAKDFIEIGLINYLNEEVKVVIYNTLGAIVYEQQFEGLALPTLQVDLQDFTYGLHVVSIRSNGLRQTKKFIHLK